MRSLNNVYVPNKEPSNNVNAKSIFIETVVDLKDESTLRVKRVFFEAILDYPIGQSV